MKKSVVAQYLEHYAAKEVLAVQSVFDAVAGGDQPHFFKNWRHCLVIPAYAEQFADVERVTRNLTKSKRERLLQIWVVNRPEAGDNSYKEATWQCFRDACKNSNALSNQGSLFLRQFNWGTVLLVDRCSSGYELSQKQGVGAARKIGGDLALKLHSMGWLKNDYCGFTDADALLPADYFDRLETLEKKKSAVVFPHQHRAEGDEVQQKMIKHYQLKLDRHVEGLQLARSPYAYYTIGSLIACQWQDYAKVRGVPPKAAGEDFYFLNKLTKLAGVEMLGGAPVILSGRCSRRVPFGTGPAIVKALQDSSVGSSIYQYNPLVYRLLAVLLAAVPEFWKNRDDPVRAADSLCAGLHEVLRGEGVKLADNIARQWLEAFEFTEAMVQMLNKSGREAIFERHFHCWFDGFRTLKFIHWWRDHGLPNIPAN